MTSAIDFIPDVAAYESQIVGDHVRMVVTVDAMHTDEMTRMQEDGFTSQLTKLDQRFASNLHWH